MGQDSRACIALVRCSGLSGWWCTRDISLDLSNVAGSIQRQVSQSAPRRHTHAWEAVMVPDSTGARPAHLCRYGPHRRSLQQAMEACLTTMHA